jgi:sugar lactone lactonase YvrE
MVEVTCVLDARAELGESTVWNSKTCELWWIDIYQDKIHRFNPKSKINDSWSTPEHPGCISFRENEKLILTMVSGFYFFDPQTKEFEKLLDPESDLPTTRFNDGKTDRQGRFWSGSMFDADEKEIEFIGGLYRLDHNLTAHKMVSNIACSNGLAWSPDSTVMYFSDSHSGEVVQYDFDPETGNIDNKRRFIDMSALGGVADGATVDSDGCYWVTIPITGKVCRFDPNGVLMQTIHLPTDCPTCCEFGGENLDTLFVTSATLNRPEKHFVNQNNPGGLFAIEGTGATGLSLCPFKG